MHKFVLEHEVPEFMEKRLNQANVKAFLEGQNPDIPNVDSEYTIHKEKIMNGPFVPIEDVANHFSVSFIDWVRKGPKNTYIKVGNTYRFSNSTARRSCFV